MLNGIILQQANDYHVYVQKLFIDYLLSGESGKPPESQGAATRENLEDERKALVQLGEEFNQNQLNHEAVISSSQKVLIKLTKNLNEQLEGAIALVSPLIKQSNKDITKEQVKAAFVHALVYGGVDPVTQKVNKNLFIDKMNELVKLTMTAEIKDKLEQQLEAFFNVLIEANESIGDLTNSVLSISEVARSFRSQFYQSALRVIDLIKLLPEYKLDPLQDQINRETLHFDKSIGETK